MKRFTPYNLLALIILVTVAIVLQECIHPIYFGQAKPQFLTAIVIYYAWTFPKKVSLSVTFACGLIYYGLGSLPWGVSILLMMGVWLFCVRFGKDQLPDTWVACIVLGIVVAPILTWLEYATLRMAKTVPELRWWFLLSRTTWSILLAGPVCAAVALSARMMNRWAKEGYDATRETSRYLG